MTLQLPQTIVVNMKYRRLLDHGWLSALFVGLAVWVFGICVKFPQGLLTTDLTPRLLDFLKLCANPFARDLSEPIIAYRISVPVLAWILHLPPTVCTFIQLLFLIASYAVLFRVVSQRTENPAFSVLVVAGLSLTFFAHWTNSWLGFPDSFSHFCSALALISSNPLVLIFTCIFGTLNDERWIFSIPFVIYWHSSARAKTDVFNRFNAGRAGGSIAGGLACVLLIRHALTVGWIGPGIEEPDLYKQFANLSLADLHPRDSTWFLYILNVTMGFGWYWFVSLRTVGRQLTSRVPVSGLLVGGALLLGSLASMLVDDVSRSIGFLYLGVVVAGVYEYDLKPRSTRALWRNLLLIGCVTPTIYYINFSGAVLIPFPFVLANYFVDYLYGVDLMEFLKVRYFRLH
jgi:hypothetical protein